MKNFLCKSVSNLGNWNGWPCKRRSVVWYGGSRW